MGQRKKENKKERNYSVWFTGIVLVLVYMILLDNMSEKNANICKSILKEQIRETSQAVQDLMGHNSY